MNYLAHLYFAEPSSESRVGQLMGDFYRGRVAADLPYAVRDAIVLHRKIDGFTDRHPRVERARARMSGPRRRYAGIILDLAFDHFLCLHWRRFSAQPLDAFLDQVYADLLAYRGPVPQRMERPLRALCEQRWLSDYADLTSVSEALRRIAGRLSRPTPLVDGGLEIERHYLAIEKDFLAFFPDLVRFVRSR